MNKLTAIKITGLAVLVAAAVYTLNRPEGTPPVSADASGAASAVSELEGQPQAEARKELVYSGMPAESERPPYPPVDENITPQTSGVTEVKVGTTSFLVYGTGVYSYSAGDGKWRIISELPVPDESLFKKYRPKAEVWTFATEIGLSAGAPGKVWAGYKFYNGEGLNGIGGAVFYDVATGEIGILRHPALLDCSAGT